MAAARQRIADSAPYFFFGTLMDRDLLGRVCGRAVEERQIEAATIAGFRRTGVVGRHYPILVKDAGARTSGILVRGLDASAGRRLIAYEGPNYRLEPVIVTDSAGRATESAVFLVVRRLRSNRRHWRLADWQRRWKRRALRRAARLFDPRTDSLWRRRAR
jgi:hypothetical protein